MIQGCFVETELGLLSLAHLLTPTPPARRDARGCSGAIQCHTCARERKIERKRELEYRNAAIPLG